MIRRRRVSSAAGQRRLPGQPAEQPVDQLTTGELQKLREDLEYLLALDTLPLLTRPREELRQELASVIAEQGERARIRRADA
jgi:hypothetical protein